MIWRWLAMLWPEAVVVLLVLFLAGMLTGRAMAEEPAYWPPCGEPGQDVRCPSEPFRFHCGGSDAGETDQDAGVDPGPVWRMHGNLVTPEDVRPSRLILEGGVNNMVTPEDFRACTRDGHAVPCDRGLEP
jgi:hypothetical protein